MKYPKRAKTSPLLQMEAVECGAASLGIICSYYGKHIPLEKLRNDCGVSRDGTSAKNVITTARKYGLTATGQRKTAAQSLKLPPPFIVFWEYNHFLVVEGADNKKVYLNDPALGKTWVTHQEFNSSYSGIVLTCTPAENFEKGGTTFSIKDKVLDLVAGSRKTILFLLLMSLLALAPALIVPSITRVIFDFILIQKNTFLLLPILLALAIAITVSSIIMGIQNIVMMKLQLKLSVLLSYKLMLKVFHLPLDFYLQRGKAEVSSRLEFANSIAEHVSATLLTSFFALLTSLFFLIVMFVYSAKLALISFILSLVSLRIFTWISGKSATQYNRMVRDRSKLSGMSFNGLQTIESIKSTGREADFFERWAGFQANVLVTGQETDMVASVNRTIPTLFSVLNMAVILLFGGLEVMDGNMTVGMLVSFIAFFNLYFVPIQNLAESGNNLQLLSSYFRSIYDVFNYPAERQIKDTESDAGKKLSGAVQIQNLTFGYNVLAPPVLNNISLDIKPGERVAFVGMSGSGKTTLAKLLCGLFQPWQGVISFDGLELGKLPQKVKTRSIGVVDQEIELFEGQVRDVLTFWDNEVPLEDIIQACQIAEIHDAISERPGGYYSIINEGGTNFSGGQRQRLEIARALIKKPSILIMDEATSALDPETEFRIGKNIKALNITTLMIAHRLSTIKDCDKIVILQNGVISHVGRHEELLQTSDLYKKFLEETD